MTRRVLSVVLALLLALAPVGAWAAEKITRITLGRKSATLFMGDQLALEARTQSQSAAQLPVTWTSSNHKVATVDAAGNVTAVKPGTATITVRAKTGKAKATCKVKVTRVYRRALVVGCSKGNLRLGASALTAVKDEVNGVARAMRVNSFDGYGISVSTALNKTKKQIRAAIKKRFAGARSTDVSYIYLSGHGIKLRGEFYMLPATDALISAAELRSWLDTIPGKVVLVVNTCYSGSLIEGKAAAASGATFANGFIEAFLGAAPSAKYTTITGEKYEVFCATSSSQLGWTYLDPATLRELDTFGTPFAAGIGWDYSDMGGVRSWLADANLDGNITGRELYAYLRKVVGKAIGAIQTVTVYPSGGSDFVLFAI